MQRLESYDRRMTNEVYELKDEIRKIKENVNMLVQTKYGPTNDTIETTTHYGENTTDYVNTTMPG